MLADRLADRVAQARVEASHSIMVGMCGPQGAGKSTLAAQLKQCLASRGYAAAVLSIDDVYLTRAERLERAKRIHPLLAVRGPPGTHDIGLALQVVDDLLGGRPVVIPRFDKSRDDRCDPSTARATGPVDIVILEGWCVGARAQSADELRLPVNALEAEEDPHLIWRTYVNEALAGDYQTLFRQIAFQVLMLAPSFQIIPRWRQDQEHALRERSSSARTMSDAEILRFVQFYQRLTNHIAEEAPGRANVVIRLDENRTPIEVEGL